LLLRLVPAKGTKSVGANDLGADTIEVSRKRGVRAALLKINKDYGLGGVFRTDAHANTENRILEHEALGMTLLAAMARAKPDGEIAARAPAGAAAVAAAAGHVKVAVVEVGPTKLTPRADVTSEIRLPIVVVLLPAKSNAMG